VFERERAERRRTRRVFLRNVDHKAVGEWKKNIQGGAEPTDTFHI
jgi:hypothetical protein